MSDEQKKEAPLEPSSSTAALESKREPRGSNYEALLRVFLMYTGFGHTFASPSSLDYLRGLLSARTRKDVEERKLSAEQQLVELVKELLKSGIDPALFDALLSNEINRRLKVRFGMYFLWTTIAFTATSYTIVVCNSIYAWQISEVAITALIIQAPIQLIGLLYIIARNLFPSAAENNANTPAV